MFIHGPERPSPTWQYAPHHRRGVLVNVDGILNADHGQLVLAVAGAFLRTVTQPTLCILIRGLHSSKFQLNLSRFCHRQSDTIQRISQKVLMFS